MTVVDSSSPTSAPAPSGPPSFLELARFFAWAGAASWGGMYVVLPKIKSEVNRRGWVGEADFDSVMAAATLVPGPTFVSLAGLIGHRARGAAGSLVAMLALMLLPTFLVASALIFLSDDLLNGPLAPLTRMITVVMGGVVLGNAYRIMRGAPWGWRGLALLLATGAAIMAGWTVAGVVVVALFFGRWLLGGGGR